MIEGVARETGGCGMTTFAIADPPDAVHRGTDNEGHAVDISGVSDTS